MKIQGYPDCCTGVILSGMGVCSTMTNDLQRESPRGVSDRVYAEVVVEMIRYGGGKAFIQAVITNEQKQALRVLRKLGFKATRPLHKLTHPETTLRIMTLYVDEGLPTMETVDQLFPEAV